MFKIYKNGQHIKLYTHETEEKTLELIKSTLAKGKCEQIETIEGIAILEISGAHRIDDTTTYTLWEIKKCQ